MIKRILCVMLVVICLTGCNKEKRESKPEGTTPSKKDRVEDIIEYSGEYYKVVDRLDTEEIFVYDFVVANAEQTITLKGYNEVEDFYNGIAIVDKYSNGTHKEGVIDINGNEVIGFGQYSFKERIVSDGYHTDLFIVRDENKKTGVISRDGKFVIPAEFSNIMYWCFSNDSNPDDGVVYMLATKDEGKTYTIYNQRGKVVYENYIADNNYAIEHYFNNRDCRNDGEGLLVVASKDGDFKYVSEKTGDVLFTGNPRMIKDGITQKDSLYYILNYDFTLIKVIDGATNITGGGEYKVVNYTDKSVVYDGEFNEIKTFEDTSYGVAEVAGKIIFYNDKGFYDESFKLIKSFETDVVISGTCRYILVDENGVKTLYNTDGTVAYENVKYVKDAIYYCEFTDKAGNPVVSYTDLDVVLKPECIGQERMANGGVAARDKNFNYTIYDNTGKEIMTVDYYQCQDITNDKTGIWEKEDDCYYDLKGNLIYKAVDN